MLKKLILLVSVAIVGMSTQAAMANFDKTLNYQGRLTDSNGMPIADNNYSMTFRIYSVDTGGAAVWTSDATTVAVGNGLFSALLSGGTPDLDTLDFNTGEFWLEVTVAGTTYSPRQRMAANAMAINADMLDGYHAADFAASAHSHATLTRGTGLTGSNYDGSAATTWAIDFGTTATTVAAGNHTHTNMVTGTGTADRVTYWNSASTISSGNLYWDNTNSRLGVAVAPGTYALNVSGTANISGNTTIGGTLGVTGAITGSSTVQGTRLISTIATGTAPLTVASTTVVTNLNADLLDGYHAADFAAAAHAHATLTRGTGLTGSNYDGSAATTWAIDFGTTATTVAAGNHTHTNMVTGTGTADRVTYWNSASTISSGNLYWDNTNSRLGVAVAPGTYALNVSGTANVSGNTTIGGTIVGSSTIQGTRLISTIATGTAPLTVASTTVVTNLNADLLDGYHAADFAASAHSHATLTRGTGLTGSNYDGSAATTWAIDFGTTATTVAAGNHTHTNMVTGTGTADRVAYWNTASTITSGGLYWDNANNRLGVNVSPTYNLHINGTGRISSNTSIGGTLGVTGAITGSSTVQGTSLISTIATGTAPLTVASTTVVTNLNADLLDGYHATDFAASAHSHATLTRGTGLTGSNYDGSTATTWAVSYGSAAGTAVQGDTSITITAGTGMSGGGSITLGSGGTVTLNNNDAGSSQFIFKNIADTTPTTQFSATTNNDTIQFAAGGRTTVSFTPASKRVTYTTTLSTLTRGTGLTGSNYDGSAAQTWAVDFGTTATTVAAGNHTHTNMVTGTGTADRVAYWNSASTIASGGLYWDNTNSRLGVAVAPGTYALNVSGTANISGNTTIGGTLGVTGAITGSSTVQGTRLISTVATGTAPLTVASTDLVTNLNADLLDGNHASAFATSGHTHAQLTAGTGILLTAYDGSTARSVSLDKDYTDSFYVLKAGDTMTGTLQGRQLNPTANNTYTLGTSALRYSTAYMVNLNASGTGTVSGLLTLGTQATGTGHAVRADRSITLATSNGILVNGTTSQTQDLTANRTYNLSLDKSHTNCAFTAATTLNVAAQDTSCAAGFCAIAAVDGAAYTTSASAKHDSASLYFNGGVAQIATLRVLCCPCQ